MCDAATCDTCTARILRALETLPAFVFHARAAVAALTTTPLDTVRVSGSKEQRLPLNTGALEAADAIHARLANWATFFADRMGITPPAPLRHWDGRNVDGFTTRTTPATARAATKAITIWLTQHLTNATHAAPGALPAFRSDLTDLTRTFAEWAPTQSRRPLRKHLCPICLTRTITINTRTTPVTATCTTCNHTTPITLTTILEHHHDDLADTQGGR